MKLNKTFLTIGTVAVAFSPLVAVVACTPSSSMGDAESKFLSFVKSPKGKQVLEDMWTKRVLDKIATDWKPLTYGLLPQKGTDKENTLEIWRKKLTKKYLVDGSSKDINFLINIANKVKGIDDDKSPIFTAAGFNKQYLGGDKYENEPNNIIDQPNGRFEEIYKILNGIGPGNNKFIKLGFASKINKMIIEKAYMSITKVQWQSVFDKKNNKGSEDDKLHNQELTEIEKKLSEKENFVLNKLALQEKLGFKWSVSLTKEENTQPFIKKGVIGTAKIGKINSAAAVLELTPFVSINSSIDTNKEHEIASLARYSVSHGKTYHEKMNVFTGTNPYDTFKGMIGYKGLVSLPSGKKQLDFSFDSMTNIERAKGKDYGFIQDNKIVQDGIEYYDHDAPNALKAPVSLTAVIAVLPRPDSSNGNLLSLNAKDATVQFDLKELSTIFALRSNSLYMDAMKYFSNMEGGIKIKVGDPYIKDILKDMGLGYIE